MHWINRSSMVPIWMCFAFVVCSGVLALFCFVSFYMNIDVVVWSSGTSFFFGFHFPSTTKFHQINAIEMCVYNWCKIVSVCVETKIYPFFSMHMHTFSIPCDDVTIITIKTGTNLLSMNNLLVWRKKIDNGLVLFTFYWWNFMLLRFATSFHLS